MPGQSSASRPNQNGDGSVGSGARRRRRGRRSAPGPSQDAATDTADTDCTPTPQEPRIPPLTDMVPPRPTPSRWIDLKVNGLPPFTPVTPWSLFDRSSLINVVMNPAATEATAAMNYVLTRMTRHASLLLAEKYDYNLERAMEDLQKFIEQSAKGFTPIAAANQTGPRQPGGARRYRNATRLVVITHSIPIRVKPTMSSNVTTSL